jgi:hypothetical protein
MTAPESSTGAVPDATDDHLLGIDLAFPVGGGSVAEHLMSPVAGYGPAAAAGTEFDFIVLAALIILFLLVVFAPPPSTWPRWRHSTRPRWRH